MRLQKASIVLAAIVTAVMLLVSSCSDTAKDISNPTSPKRVDSTPVDANGNPLPALLLSDATAWVQSVSPNSANSTVEFHLLVSYDMQAPIDRLLVIKSSRPSPSERRLDMGLKDLNGLTLWAYELTYDITQAADFTLAETSPSDRMTIRHEMGVYGYTETYAINGDTRCFTFQTTDVGHVIALEEDMIEAGADMESFKSQLSPADRAIAATLEDFFSYYSADNSLHGNVDGRLVVELLTQEAIYSELIWKNVDGSLGGPISLDVHEICIIAADCAMLKCPVAAVNYGCGICGAVVAICFFIELSRMLF